jgi:hypothetical protein
MPTVAAAESRGRYVVQDHRGGESPTEPAIRRGCSAATKKKKLSILIVDSLRAPCTTPTVAMTKQMISTGEDRGTQSPPRLRYIMSVVVIPHRPHVVPRIRRLAQDRHNQDDANRSCCREQGQVRDYRGVNPPPSQQSVEGAPPRRRRSFRS